jgi:hypothetical protein
MASPIPWSQRHWKFVVSLRKVNSDRSRWQHKFSQTSRSSSLERNSDKYYQWPGTRFFVKVSAMSGKPWRFHSVKDFSKYRKNFTQKIFVSRLYSTDLYSRNQYKCPTLQMWPSWPPTVTCTGKSKKNLIRNHMGGRKKQYFDTFFCCAGRQFFFFFFLERGIGPRLYALLLEFL